MKKSKLVITSGSKTLLVGLDGDNEFPALSFSMTLCLRFHHCSELIDSFQFTNCIKSFNHNNLVIIASSNCALKMDVIMTYQNQVENEQCTVRKNRIKMFKSFLNYYKGRSLSLNYVLACKQPNVSIPPDMKTHEALCKNIQGLHDDITLIQSIRSSLKLINWSLSSTELMSVNDCNYKREILNKIAGIIYFSKSIMKLYDECSSELELIEKMKNYSKVLTDYKKNLERLKEQENNGSDEDSQGIEKAELQIYKINLMRTMKSILIGYISLNCPNLLRNVRDFKTSLRRDLTIDDFRDKWDVGLSS